MPTDNKITIYTDGSCLVNPGPGGWGALVLPEQGEPERLSGGEAHTTNNRMEMTGAIKGLEATAPGASVDLYSDSSYLVNTMTKNWKRRKNNDLWDQLDALARLRKVNWLWVRGHNGDPGNEEADRLAGNAMKFAADGKLARPEAQLSLDVPVSPNAPVSPKAPVTMEDDQVAIESNRPALTHLDEEGRARMVDVGAKPVTSREAVARGYLVVQPETLRLIKDGLMKKGDVLSIAQLAGIMGAKKTSDLIPLCHPLPLDRVNLDLDLDEEQNRVNITATASTSAKTGVEMEALTAVSVAALTVYDMCKAVDRGIRIEGIRLVRKTGGQSGDVFLEE